MMTTAPATDFCAAYDQGRLPPQLVTSYQHNGWVLLPGLLSRTWAARLRVEILEIMATIGLPITCLRQTGEFLPGGAVHALVHSAQLRVIASALLAGPAHLYGPFTAVKSPGGGALHFHQDNQYTVHDGPSINLWTALEPVDEGNGCLQIVTGSHRGGTLPAVATAENHRGVSGVPDRVTVLRMQPGDCVAFSRLTVHGSGINHTPMPRVAYAVQYHREDVKATWDGNGWMALAKRPRWTFGPVERLSVPEGSGDG